MKNDSIKILKRGQRRPKEEPTRADPRKAERAARNSALAVVGDWISERRENNRLERVFSDGKIAIWKGLPYADDRND